MKNSDSGKDKYPFRYNHESYIRPLFDELKGILPFLSSEAKNALVDWVANDYKRWFYEELQPEFNLDTIKVDYSTNWKAWWFARLLFIGKDGSVINVILPKEIDKEWRGDYSINNPLIPCIYATSKYTTDEIAKFGSLLGKRFNEITIDKLDGAYIKESKD